MLNIQGFSTQSPKTDLKASVVTGDRKNFERRSQKRPLTCVHLDFSSEVVARTRVSEPGMSVV